MTSSSTIEHRYSAETSPRGFLHHAPRVFALPACALRHRTLFWHFFGRELTSRFQGTALGPAWVLVQPLFLFLVYFLVFGIGFRQASGDLGKSFFAIYLFSGIVCFHSITAATTAAMNSITGNANLVKKVAFPCELLPVVPAAVEGTVMMVGFLLALVTSLGFGVASLGVDFLALPLFVIVLLSITTGLGLLLANLNVFVRDVRQLYSIITTPWLFMSPNFWFPGSMLTGELAWIEPWMAALNPAYCLLLAERQILGLGFPELGIVRSVWGNLAISATWGLVLLLIGYGTFMANKRKYADLV